MSQEFENFKVILARLHVAGIRIQHTFFALDQYAKDFLYAPTLLTRAPTDAELIEINKKILQQTVSLTALFERLVINLYNILESHKELEKYLKDKGLEKLEGVLSDCWKTLKENEELICKWRNQILAHGKTWNKDEIFAITEITKDTFEAQKSIYHCSGCAVIYLQGLLNNIKEYPEVFQEFKKKHDGIPKFSYKDYLKTKPKLKVVLEDTLKKLQNVGFKAEISLELK